MLVGGNTLASWDVTWQSLPSSCCFEWGKSSSSKKISIIKKKPSEVIAYWTGLAKQKKLCWNTKDYWVKAKKKRKFRWKNNGWYTPRARWGDKLSTKQELFSISLPPAMLRPDKRMQYPRIYCDLDDPKYDLFAQYQIRVEKTLGLLTKMTLVAESRKKQAEARVAASAKPYTTAQSLQLRRILMNAASGPLFVMGRR